MPDFTNLLVAALAVLAGAAGDSVPEYSGAGGELWVETPRLAIPEDIRVDGALTEAAWARAAVLTDFTLYEPVEGVLAEHATDVLVFYDEAALYFGIRARDPDPGAVRATVVERDNVAESANDWVRIVLDTHGGAQRAYVFYVNPLGIQQDGLWIEGYRDRRGGGFGPPIDKNPDFRWSSRGRLTQDGYQVEIRIPFKTLRFPAGDVQAWGLHINRSVQRSGYESSWAPITEERPNQLLQMGRLAGLSGVDRGILLEVNPVLTGRKVGSYDAERDAFTREEAQADFGLNTTYGLTSNLTIDATYNPDFSQIEADAGQIAANERFALFFPEKRPFFLEGTEIFQMPRQLVYTRRIVDPVAGAKLTGQVGGFQTGYLAALDEFGDGALFNLVRLKRDVGGGSIGAAYTDRTGTEGDGVFNRVAAADARLLLGERYTLEMVGAGSWDRDSTNLSIVDGSLLVASLERSGRELSFETSLEDVDSDFRSRSGFIRRTGYLQSRTVARLNRFRDPGSLVEGYGAQVEIDRFWEREGLLDPAGVLEGKAGLAGSVSFRNNRFIRLGLERSLFGYRAADYEGIVDLETRQPYRPGAGAFDGLTSVSFTYFDRSLRWLRGFVRGSWGEQAIFEPFVAGVDQPVRPAIAVADALSLRSSFTLQPTTSFSVELGLQHEELYREDGSRYSTASIPRLQAQYQFTSALFFRTIAEYVAEELHPVRDAQGRVLARCPASDECVPLQGEPRSRMHVEALLSYQPAPGTIFYAGYSRDMVDVDRFAFERLEPRAEGLFIKLSYLHRF